MAYSQSQSTPICGVKAYTRWLKEEGFYSDVPKTLYPEFRVAWSSGE